MEILVISAKMFTNLTTEEEESALTFLAVLPGMEIFPQIRGIHISDGEFQFGFGEIHLFNLNFKRNKFIYIWGIF